MKSCDHPKSTVSLIRHPHSAFRNGKKDRLMSTDAALEDLTLRYGREIFSRLDRTGPVPFGPAWWDNRLMEWSMGDEEVKVQLFRFVDVLPLLRSPADITRHLREYFDEAGPSVPRWIHAGLRLLPERG